MLARVKPEGTIADVLGNEARYHVACSRSDDLMAQLPDGCINLAVFDIPYHRAIDADFDNQWASDAAFFAWVGEQADGWRRVLAPNGTLYVFASPRMAWGVEGVVRERFEVLSNIRWAKPFSRANQTEKEVLRAPFPASETILMAEQKGADQVALNRSGYAAKCEEARGFIFEPLRAYLDGERERAGLSAKQCNQACGNQMAGHYFSSVQWTLPTLANYEKLRQAAGPGFFARDYEALRRDYEALRRDYEALRRPFTVSADVPYTDVWTYPTVSAYEGKHPCEKPEQMASDIIAASSRPGDVVADFYCGSGIFLAEAVKAGWRAIGGDMDAHWADVTRLRCAMAVSTGRTTIRKIPAHDPKQRQLF